MKSPALSFAHYKMQYAQLFVRVRARENSDSQFLVVIQNVGRILRFWNVWLKSFSLRYRCDKKKEYSDGPWGSTPRCVSNLQLSNILHKSLQPCILPQVIICSNSNDYGHNCENYARFSGVSAIDIKQTC